MKPFPDGTMLDPSFTEPLQKIQFLNGSRNPTIDDVVQPGPYKEILPCADLCYNLVQSCPASFGFGCPQMGDIGFNQSYGNPPTLEQGSQTTCNYPGVLFLSGGVSLGKTLGFWDLTLLVGVMVSLMA